MSKTPVDDREDVGSTPCTDTGNWFCHQAEEFNCSIGWEVNEKSCDSLVPCIEVLLILSLWAEISGGFTIGTNEVIQYNRIIHLYSDYINLRSQNSSQQCHQQATVILFNSILSNNSY